MDVVPAHSWESALATDLGKAVLVIMAAMSGLTLIVVMVTKLIRPRNGNGNSITSPRSLEETIRRIEARQATIEASMTTTLEGVVVEVSKMGSKVDKLCLEVRGASARGTRDEGSWPHSQR